MRFLVQISRLFVGVLFILSGWVKLNDPMGFSFKLEEYFSPAVFNLEFLSPYTLELSLFVVIFEILLGVFLLLGYKPKFTLWSLFLMILFFTGLTFYSAYFNVVTDCGCFGDAVKLTPWESFSKDIILMVLILFLMWGIRYINPIFSKKIRVAFGVLSLVFSIGYAYYVLQHLPVVDFRPYKIGNNIVEGMSIPEGAPKGEHAFHWKFNVNGEERIVTTSGAYPDIKGTYLGVETEEISKGYEPPIHDFTIERDGVDKTDLMMEESNLIMIISHDLNKSDRNAFRKVKEFTDEALLKGYKVIGMSASNPEQVKLLQQEFGLNFQYYFTDQTTLKTIVRSNPGILVVNKGTIVNKKHHNDMQEVVLEELPNANPNLNLDLKRKLDSVYVLDQKYRSEIYQSENQKEIDSLWKLQLAIDKQNIQFVERVIKNNGYPGKSIVGEPTNKTAWYIIQHSDKIVDYIDVLRTSGKKEEFPFTLVAMTEDRLLVSQQKKQRYGTQIVSVGKDGEKFRFVWPIQDAHYVDQRREEAGFEKTVAEYCNSLGVQYKPVSLKQAIKLLNTSN